MLYHLSCKASTSMSWSSFLPKASPWESSLSHVTVPSLKQCVVYSAMQSEAVTYLVQNSMTHLSSLRILDGCCVYALSVVSIHALVHCSATLYPVLVQLCKVFNTISDPDQQVVSSTTVQSMSTETFHSIQALNPVLVSCL